MTTNLYPHTHRREIIEALAGVPNGTCTTKIELEASLEQLSNQKLKEMTGQADQTDFDWECFYGGREHAIYCLVQKEPYQNKLQDFEMFGWGELQGKFLVEGAGLNPTGGQTRDLHLMKALLKAQGITLPPTITTDSLEGLCWA